MTDAGKMIDLIISSLSSARENVYRDEPIVTTAARAAEALPEKYREMRRIGRDDPSLLASEARLFAKQAKFMEDFEDSYDYNGVFIRYFPTYRHMSDRQLRGYFSWRTKVRRGIVEETSLSFAFVYLYELINLVGAEDVCDAAEALDRFVDRYSVFDRSVARYARRWRRDMAIYCGESEAFPKTDAQDTYHAAVRTLDAPREAGEDELFRAITALSSFNPERSKLFRQRPDEAKALLCRIFAAFADFCETHRKVPLTERLFGRKKERAYVIFPSAVFCDVRRREERTFVSPGGQVYKCKNGVWTVTGYPEIKKKSAELGALVKSIDAVLREFFGIEQSKEDAASAVLRSVAAKEIAAYFEELRRAEASKVEFDFSKLDVIRASSDVTAELLVTEDERESEEDAPVCEEVAESAPTFTDDEKEIVRLIASGGDGAGYARSRGLLLSVVVDNINEKLFDLLLDNAIEFEDEAPRIVEDYMEDVKGFIEI